MQVNAQSKQKYKVLIFLHLTLFLLNGELPSYGIMLSFILFSGILYYLIKIYQDENTLIEFVEIKHKILTNMSHEFRTPLNSVIGFSEQLGQSKLNDTQTEQLMAIRSSSIIMLDLVNDILNLSKYEMYKINFNRIPFAPFEIIGEVINGIVIQANQKDIELKSEISFKNSICFIGDSLRLKQVVINLLSNAIKFTEKGSVILKSDIVIVGKKRALLKVQIIDTGIGIEAKDLDRIFDEYYSQKGTGLGLAISKKIVELQEGEIKVISELGKGSTFSFSIPYEIGDGKDLKNECPTINHTSNLVGKRILLADDHKMNVLLTQTIINKYKMLIHIAYDGEQALELFQKNEYDLVLTDIQMPIMNGVELSKAIRLRGNAMKQNIPILGITANVLIEDRELYLGAGMNDLVLKPFSENELIEKIASQLKGSQSTVSSGC